MPPRSTVEEVAIAGTGVTMPPPSTVEKVAIVGTGVIGSGWAALFCAKGYTVVAFVRSPASQTKFRNFLEAAWQKLVQRGLATEPDGYKRVSCVMNLAECVADADYVQESVAEDLSLKQFILQDIDNFAPSHVIVGSSTSFIPLSLLRMRAKKHPERIAIAHPSLPQWDSFCEVLGSSETITQWLAAMYGKADSEEDSPLSGSESWCDTRCLGMDVVAMKREWHGHAFNTFTLTCAMTASTLVHAGVCSAQDADKALFHFASIVVAGGGLSGTLVGIVGGGSVEASTELMADIGLGAPIGWGAVLVSRLLPSFLAKPVLWLLQTFWWPTKFLKALLRRCVSWWYKTFFLRYDESPSGSAAFEATALKRICALEKIAE